MTDNPELRQVDATVRQLVTKLRDDIYPGLNAANQRKRVVINYDPLFEIAELPQIILESFMMSRNLFHRQVGYEAAEKDYGVDDVTFTGTGTDDFTASGIYIGDEDLDFVVEIDGTETYKWSKDNGGSWEAEDQPITTDLVELIDEVYLQFGGDTGHDVGDKWEWSVLEVPLYTQRAYPVYLDLGFSLVVVTDKVRDLIPLYEQVIAWVEGNKYLAVGEEDTEPYEAYEYGLSFEDPIGQSSLVPNADHLNRLSLRGVVEAVRVYPGIQLSGKLLRYRIFRLYDMDGATLMEEVDTDPS